MKKSTIIFIIALAVLTGVRIFIGMNIPIRIVPNAIHDDVWMVYAANLKTHFAVPDNLSLIKTMSFPVFLQVVNILYIPLRLAITLLWIVAAGLTTLFVCRLTKNAVLITAVYAFVLYCPAAFEAQIGVRLYRNMIIAPAVFIVLALLLLMAHFIIFRRGGAVKGFVLSALLGFALQNIIKSVAKPSMTI